MSVHISHRLLHLFLRWNLQIGFVQIQSRNMEIVRRTWWMLKWKRKILFADINSNHMAVNCVTRHRRLLLCVIGLRQMKLWFLTAITISNENETLYLRWLSLSSVSSMCKLFQWSLLMPNCSQWRMMKISVKEKETWTIVKRAAVEKTLLQKFSRTRNDDWNKFFTSLTLDYQLHFSMHINLAAELANAVLMLWYSMEKERVYYIKKIKKQHISFSLRNFSCN